MKKAEQLRMKCSTCQGTGSEGQWHDYGRSADYDAGPCSECAGAGDLPAICEAEPCGQPAFAKVGANFLCDRCAGLCSLCEVFAAPTDRLPWGHYGAVVHVFCALSFQAGRPIRPQILEVTDFTVEAVPGARARARALEDPHGGNSMPTPAESLLRAMERDGFITTKEAVSLSGHSLSTLYDWIATGRLKGRRSGIFHFVDRASLEQLCPHIRRAS